MRAQKAPFAISRPYVYAVIKLMIELEAFIGTPSLIASLIRHTCELVLLISIRRKIDKPCAVDTHQLTY